MGVTIFIAPEVRAALDALLASEARLVTVHGLGGSGASSLVTEALEGRGAVRIDLSGVARGADVTRLLSRAGGARLVHLDQVHRPELLRRPLEAMLKRSRSRFVVAARAPLGCRLEHRVALAPLSRELSQRLMEAECRRLGHVPTDLSAAARLADGWPLLARALAAHAWAGGPSSGDRPIVEVAPEGAAILADAWRSLTPRARARLLTDSCARSGTPVGDVHDAAIVGALRDRGLVVIEHDRARPRTFVASWLAAHAPRRALAAARRRFVAQLLGSAEHALAQHRRTPSQALAALEAALPDLAAVALEGAPKDAVRAALALEPLLRGRLTRDGAMAIWDRARRLASTKVIAGKLALGHARTLIGRGDHETAEVVLAEALAVGTRASRAYAHVYLGHIAAWRGALEPARAHLAEVERALGNAELARSTDAEGIRQDLWVQQMFVAHQAHRLEETEKLARLAAAHADRAGAPRLAAIARRFTAEVLLRRNAAARAVPLFARSRDELAEQGDAAAAVFTTSRLVEALRAAGDHERAEEEARTAALAAARADEATLELALVDAGHSAPRRVAEMVWRAQIPAIRARAEAWLQKQAPAAPAPVLRLDATTFGAGLGARSVSLGRRPTLWRMLLCLVEPRGRGVPRSSDVLFQAGWPAERASAASRKKRVQTAIWTLRRAVLGEALTTTPTGYLLSPELEVVTVA